MNYGFRQWTSRPMSQSHLSFGFQGNNPWSWPHDKTALSFHKVREIDWPFQLSLASAQRPWCRFRGGRLLTPRTQSASGEPRAGSFCASDSQWQALSQGRLASCLQEGYLRQLAFTCFWIHPRREENNNNKMWKEENTLFAHGQEINIIPCLTQSVHPERDHTVLLSASDPALDLETMWTSTVTRGSVWEWGNRCQLGHQRHLLHSITQYSL